MTEFKGQEDAPDPTTEPIVLCGKMLKTGTGSTHCRRPQNHEGDCSELEMAGLLTIGFFGIRAVRRQVVTIQRFSEFSVAYKTLQALSGESPEWPTAQTYEAWLRAFQAWDALNVTGEGEGETVKPLAPSSTFDPPSDPRCEIYGEPAGEGGALCPSCLEHSQR